VQQVIDARWADATMGWRVGLLPVVVLNDDRDLPHQLSAGLKVGGLLGCVGDRTPRAAQNLGLGHWAPLIRTVNRTRKPQDARPKNPPQSTSR